MEIFQGYTGNRWTSLLAIKIYIFMALLSKICSKNVKRNNVFDNNSPHCGTYNQRISEIES